MSDSHDHERRFHGSVEALRSPERVALLEIERVVDFCIDGLTVLSALDVGTGTGIFAEAFANKGLQVVGIDVSSEMLQTARRLARGVEFREAAAEALPFPDASFDLVFLGHVLHETDDPFLALREARRTVRERVIVLEWPYRADGHGPPLEHRLKPETIAELSFRAGFRDVERRELAHMDLYRLTV